MPLSIEIKHRSYAVMSFFAVIMPTFALVSANLGFSEGFSRARLYCLQLQLSLPAGVYIELGRPASASSAGFTWAWEGWELLEMGGAGEGWYTRITLRVVMI